MAPSIKAGPAAGKLQYSSRGYEADYHGSGHHMNGTSSSSISTTSSSSPAATSPSITNDGSTAGGTDSSAALPSPSGESDTSGAIVGGVVAASTLLVGLLLWWWKRTIRTRKAKGLKEKFTLDPEDRIGANAIPVPATHLLPPRIAAEEGQSPSDSVICQASEGNPTYLTISEEQIPPTRIWQVHNASSSSLQNAIVQTGSKNEKHRKSLSIQTSSGPTPEPDPFATPISPISRSPTAMSVGTFAFSSPGHTTEDSHDNTTLPTSVEEEEVSEIVHLRRRVTLLTQENARLNAAAQNMLQAGIPPPTDAEAPPPAYENQVNSDSHEVHSRQSVQC